MMRVVVQRPQLYYTDGSRDAEAVVLSPLRAAAQKLPGLTLVVVDTDEEALHAVRGQCTHAFIGGAGDTLADVVAAAGPSLRWVQVQSAGTESYPHAALEAAGVTLTSGAVIYGPQLADHVLALVLAFSRQLHFLFGTQQERRWAGRHEFPPGELAGQTLLVVGLGGAGLETARRARGFGMRVVATRRTPRPDTSGAVERVLGPSKAELHTLLPAADWVAVCCSLNADTLGLFGAHEFALMKSTAVIISVARGRVIQADALLDALHTGSIGGAGLDVTDPEPLPPGHALWRAPNTIITPHSSGHSPNADARFASLAVDNLTRFYHEGATALRNRVDLKRDRLAAKL